MKVSQKALEVALVLGGSIVRGSLEFGVADIGFAVLTPVFGLCRLLGAVQHSQLDKVLQLISSIPTW